MLLACRYVKDLGRGSFGSVILAEDTATSTLLAVKKIQRDYASDPTLERELLLHSKLRHPHIVKFQQVCTSSTMPHGPYAAAVIAGPDDGERC